jgi:hypothetical protein
MLNTIAASILLQIIAEVPPNPSYALLKSSRNAFSSNASLRAQCRCSARPSFKNTSKNVLHAVFVLMALRSKTRRSPYYAQIPASFIVVCCFCCFALSTASALMVMEEEQAQASLSCSSCTWCHSAFALSAFI